MDFEKDLTDEMLKNSYDTRIMVINEFLRKSGFREGSEAFYRMAIAVELKMKRPRQSDLFKTIYEKVAGKRNTTAKAVEKSLRSAVNRAWAKRNDMQQGQYNLFNDRNKRPYTGEFISFAAEAVKMRIKALTTGRKNNLNQNGTEGGSSQEKKA